jgi:hypothetical protein
MCSHYGTDCCMTPDSMKQSIHNVRAVPSLMVDEVQCVLSVVHTVVTVEVAVIWDVMLCDVDNY